MALTIDRRRFGRSALILLGLVVARGSAAATPDSAQDLFSQGVEAARQDRWNDARAAFEQAYALSPRSVVLINLAGAQANTGRLKEAAANYRRVLDDAAPETAPFRTAAAGVLPSLEARIPRIRLHATGVRPDDVVEIDGQAVPLDSLEAPHLLDPGAHVITVARAGAQRARVTVSLDEGESHEVSVTVPPDSPPAAAAGVPMSGAPGLDLTRTATPPTPDQPHRSWWRSPWVWTAAAVAVVGSVVAVVLIRNRNQEFSGNVPPYLIHVP
ncbi:MAG: hypothetical protein ABUS79_02630 [Pseudomonadota bacterium]